MTTRSPTCASPRAPLLFLRARWDTSRKQTDSLAMPTMGGASRGEDADHKEGAGAGEEAAGEDEYDNGDADYEEGGEMMMRMMMMRRRRRRRGEEEERGGPSLQNEDPTPQDGWEKKRALRAIVFFGGRGACY